MRKLFLMFLVLNASICAQSVMPQALQETLNLAPRCQRGDAQVYSIKVEIVFPNDDGKPTSVKNNRINYTQLCLANNPDSGLIYEITVDSFSVGSLQAISGSDYDRRTIVDSLRGLTFRSQFRSKIPVTGNCYDIGIPLTTGFPYLEAWEFIDDFLPVKILEELYYTAGKRLSKIGDTATIVWPGPICYSIKKVINESIVEQKPFKLTLTGLTSYRGTPCATISVASAVSPYRVEIYSTDTTSFKGSGTSQITGEFQVSLQKGIIMYAKMGERLETTLTRPDKQPKPRKVLKTTELTLRTW
jgi:hypothetical protein